MTQLKLIIYGVILAALAGILTTCYMKGRSDANSGRDLSDAKTTIKQQVRRQGVEQATNTRVDAESIETETQAKAADDEIERIRQARDQRGRAAIAPVRPTPATPVLDIRGTPDPSVHPSDDPDAARVMQLAREARAAALESSARLQSARAGAR